MRLLFLSRYLPISRIDWGWFNRNIYFLVLRYPNKISSYDKRAILIILALSFIFTLSAPNISISGHVGGIISGFVLAFIISILDSNKKDVFFSQNYTLSIKSSS
ncbi:rhomboid family intramembrane serine protease [Viridibacillus sp. YIM B01967]|uniref:Rhomboid family intramembrane serine protease n=1 Tax=Viridibacillus soli TaxID=2798301 RepID=A0ABS1H472_9BACL|nr:rhomboid family intramembrane serine protease [Viridibacillus soli]